MTGHIQKTTIPKSSKVSWIKKVKVILGKVVRSSAFHAWRHEKHICSSIKLLCNPLFHTWSREKHKYGCEFHFFRLTKQTRSNEFHICVSKKLKCRLEKHICLLMLLLCWMKKHKCKKKFQIVDRISLTLFDQSGVQVWTALVRQKTLQKIYRQDFVL